MNKRINKKHLSFNVYQQDISLFKQNTIGNYTNQDNSPFERPIKDRFGSRNKKVHIELSDPTQDDVIVSGTASGQPLLVDEASIIN